jgi:uncharacterized protein (DUF2252 family)
VKGAKRAAFAQIYQIDLIVHQDLKPEIETLSGDEARSVAEFLAHVVGHGHARQMERRTASGGPSFGETGRTVWLWNSVVDLVAAHEATYLHHCRR